MPPVDIAALAKDQTLPVLYYCHRVIFAEWTYKVVHGYFLFLQYSSCLTNNLSASSGCAIISNTIFSMRRPCEPFTKIKSPLLIKVFTNTAASSEVEKLLIFFFGIPEEIAPSAVNFDRGPTVIK